MCGMQKIQGWKMTDREITQIEALANEAHSAPWYAYSNVIVSEANDRPPINVAMVLDNDDAAFIEAARKAVPKMAAEIRRLRAALERISEYRYRNETEMAEAAKEALE